MKYDGEEEPSNAKFITNNILVKGVSVQYRITKYNFQNYPFKMFSCLVTQIHVIFSEMSEESCIVLYC